MTHITIESALLWNVLEALKASKRGDLDHRWAEEAIAVCVQALAPPAQPAQQKPLTYWISVDDRLPNDRTDALAFSDGRFIITTYGAAYGWIGSNKRDVVTHWMPLLKPALDTPPAQRKPLTIDECLRDFESWLHSQGQHAFLKAPEGSKNTFWDGRTEDRWLGWKAAHGIGGEA